MVFEQLLIHVLFGRTENLDNELGYDFFREERGSTVFA